MSIDIQEGKIPGIETEEELEQLPGMPQDEAPVTTDENMTGWFNAEYPYSTQEYPYGYFSLPDGSPDYSKPRKRRPHSKRSSTGNLATSTRADTTAKTAAALLARMNSLFSLGLLSVGLPMTRDTLLASNDQFESMAYEALLTDPVLARKILSAGASSGKAQLTMAYVVLGGSIAPTAYMEFKAKRE